MIDVQRDRNGDFQKINKTAHHVGDRPIAAHVFRRSAGNAEYDRRLNFLGREQKSADAFHIIKIEVPHRIAAFFRIDEHFFCRY